MKAPNFTFSLGKKRPQLPEIGTYKLIFLSLLITNLVGLLVGVLVASGGGATAFTNSIFQDFLSNRVDVAFFSIFTAHILSAAILILPLFLLGPSAIGAPLAYIAVAYKGLGSGITLGFLYSNFGAQGVLFALSIVIPATFLANIGLILAARETVLYSRKVFKLMTVEKENNTLPRVLAPFCKKYFAIAIIVVMAALLDAGMSAIFINLFDF